jgi:hypothetical protein
VSHNIIQHVAPLQDASGKIVESVSVPAMDSSALTNVLSKFSQSSANELLTLGAADDDGGRACSSTRLHNGYSRTLPDPDWTGDVRMGAIVPLPRQRRCAITGRSLMETSQCLRSCLSRVGLRVHDAT